MAVANGEKPLESDPKTQLPTPSSSPALEDQGGEADGPERHWKHKILQESEDAEPSRECGVDNLPTLETVIETPHERSNEDPGVSRKRSIGKIASPVQGNTDGEKVLKLSPARIQELMSSPQSLPLRNAPVIEEEAYDLGQPSSTVQDHRFVKNRVASTPQSHVSSQGVQSISKDVTSPSNFRETPNLASIKLTPGASSSPRPSMSSRAASTPHLRRRQSSSKQTSSNVDQSKSLRTPPAPLKLDGDRNRIQNGSTSLRPSPMPDHDVSPMPTSLPLPPLSIPAYLQLELSSERPSPLYIYRSSASDIPYESSRIKFERLVNFLLLPPELERVLVFGTLSCLDAFLYTFTILPLRFFIAIGLIIKWVFRNLIREVTEIGNYIRHGLGRMLRRRRKTLTNGESAIYDTIEKDEDYVLLSDPNTSKQRTSSSRESTNVASEVRRFVKGHRRTRSAPSALLPEHKADILKGLLVVTSCVILNYFDASRMYHSIRGQAAIKLYVIYNALEAS